MKKPKILITGSTGFIGSTILDFLKKKNFQTYTILKNNKKRNIKSHKNHHLILYKNLSELEKKLKKHPVKIFEEALENIIPKVEVRSRRIGGATYQIPVEVSARRGSALALKWLKTSIENIKGKSLASKVSIVILESIDGKGWAAKKKEEERRRKKKREEERRRRKKKKKRKKPR